MSCHQLLEKPAWQTIAKPFCALANMQLIINRLAEGNQKVQQSGHLSHSRVSKKVQHRVATVSARHFSYHFKHGKTTKLQSEVLKNWQTPVLLNFKAQTDYFAKYRNNWCLTAIICCIWFWVQKVFRFHSTIKQSHWRVLCNTISW